MMALSECDPDKPNMPPQATSLNLIKIPKQKLQFYYIVYILRQKELETASLVKNATHEQRTVFSDGRTCNDATSCSLPALVLVCNETDLRSRSTTCAMDLVLQHRDQYGEACFQTKLHKNAFLDSINSLTLPKDAVDLSCGI